MYIDVKIKLIIGTRVYAVHKKYVDENITGGSIKICKVKTFENKGGKIRPVLSIVGNAKQTINHETHYIYYDEDQAVEAIATLEKAKGINT